MSPYRVRQNWRQDSDWNKAQNHTCYTKPAGKPDSRAHHHRPQDQEDTASMQILTRSRLSSNNPYKNLWGWDDFDRRSLTRKKTFVCYECTGQLNPWNICSDCWLDNTRMFRWLKSLNVPYEKMMESTESGGDEVVVASRAQQEDSEDWGFDSISQRGENQGERFIVSAYCYKERKRPAWLEAKGAKQVPVVNLPKEAPRGWYGIESGLP